MIDTIKIEECTGCWACTNICPINCIDMKENKEGFLYPVVDEDKCIKCKKCINICPIKEKKEIKNNPSAYACFNKDEVIRKESSSGGIFTLLSNLVINNNGVVFGALFNGEFDVEHGYVEKIEEIKKIRGSKYVQSKIGYSYSKVKEFLDNGKIVLFSGTPCQIAGLKSFLGKEYDNLICVDLVCHGVPSPIAWRKYRDEISCGKEISNISFRDKTYGWKDYSFRMDFKDGTTYLNKGAENKYIRGFIGDIYLRPSCHNCKFKSLNRDSDLTLADFWGIENICKDMDDGIGTSFVIVNSEKGRKLVDSINSNIEIKEVKLDDVVKYNMSAVKSSYCNPRREYFFKHIDKWEFDKLVDKSLRDPFIVRIKTKVYRILKKFNIK